MVPPLPISLLPQRSLSSSLSFCYSLSPIYLHSPHPPNNKYNPIFPNHNKKQALISVFITQKPIKIFSPKCHSDIDMVQSSEGFFAPKQSKVVILWDLDNKPPRGPPYEAAIALKTLAEKFGQVVDISAYANRHAFSHLPNWVLEQRRERRRLDILERKDDSDFKDMLRRAREANLGTVVVGDLDRALGRHADLWVPWIGVENGEVSDKDLVVSKKQAFDGHDGLFSVSGFDGSVEVGFDLARIVDELVVPSGCNARRNSAFSDGEEEEEWQNDFEYSDDDDEYDDVLNSEEEFG